MKNLIEAVIKVTKEVGNIEKNLNVGAGNNSYKGIADKDVKKSIGDAMGKNGLAIFPIKIEPTTTIRNWEEKTNYGLKQKQAVFTEVLTTYKLYHKSGECIEIQGYGHGVDSQDKSAGKATTYAMKYALLYQFMIATGSIDDTDNTNSIDIKEPVKQVVKKTTQAKTKQWITDEQFEKAKSFSLKDLEKLFDCLQFRKIEQQEELTEIYNNLKSK